MAVTIAGIEELRARVGQHLGFSEWTAIDQATIDAFAAATGDHQWIHVDEERAKRESPYGGTIAHGYLIVSLVPRLAPEIYRVEGVRMSVNYGCDRVRFPRPVPAGASVRMGAQLEAVEPVGEDTAQIAMRFTFEVRDPGTDTAADKPACVVDALFRYRN